jgi:hypothetical protein
MKSIKQPQPVPQPPQDDRGMMGRPFYWPHYPILPVKRYTKKDTMPECAVMAAIEPRWRVYHKLLGQLGSGKLKDVLGDNFTEYGSVDELLADGWVVD